MRHPSAEIPERIGHRHKFWLLVTLSAHEASGTSDCRSFIAITWKAVLAFSVIQMQKSLSLDIMTQTGRLAVSNSWTLDSWRSDQFLALLVSQFLREAYSITLSSSSQNGRPIEAT